MKRVRQILAALGGAVWLLLAALAFAPGIASAWTDELIEAAYAVAKGNSTPAQEALVVIHNKAINQMAIAGKIPDGVYQANQTYFNQVNGHLVRESAKEAGLKAVTQAKKPGTSVRHNPGTDTDIIVESAKPGERITLDKIQKTEQAYQRRLRELYKDSGVNIPDGKVNTDTDFMPNPKDTTPDEFRRINRYVNESGGTAYESPAAAEVEANLRAGRPVTVNQSSEYVSEMQKLAGKKLDAARELDRQAVRAATKADAAAMRADAQLARSQAGKYIERINSVTDDLAARFRVPGSGAAEAGEKGLGGAISRVTAPGARGAGTATDAAIVGGLGKYGTDKALRNYAETLARIANADPSQAANAQRNIAQQVSKMTAAQKGQLIETVEQIAGKNFAKGLAKEMRAASEAGEGAGQGAAKGGGRVAKVMKVLGPVLILHDGYGRVKQAWQAKDEDKPQVALEQGGEFVGGAGGAMAGAAGGAALGAAIGSAVPIVGTAAGGLIGGIVGGVTGYFGGSWGGHAVGSAAAAKLGVKQDAHMPQLVGSAEYVFEQLVNRGVPPAAALMAARALLAGKLSDFKKIMAEIRREYGRNGAYVTSRHQQRDWYCTNRPSIEAPVALPPIIQKR